MKKTIIIALSALLFSAGLILVYVNFFRQPSAESLYKESIEEALRAGDQDIFVSFHIDSKNAKYRGNGQLVSSTDEIKVRANMDVSAEFDGIPAQIVAEMISIEGDSQDSYLRYKSVDSDGSEFSDLLVDYFKPALNKWVRISADEEDGPVSFEEQGALATMSVANIFMPFGELDQDGQDSFLDLADKYNLYIVDEEVESTTFKGVNARKVSVSIEKDPFIEFQNELESQLSSDNEFEKFKTAFIDDLFGSNDKLSADVYVDAESAQIVGLELDIEVDESVEHTAFNVAVGRVKASFLIDRSRSSSIEAPSNYITEDEFNALLDE